jgi:hypothetical protein
MRSGVFLLPLLALAACGGGADVSGTALGIPFADTPYVFFGGPFIVISNIETDCEALSFVRGNYEVGSAPTEDDAQLLQFGFTAGDVVEGQKSISVTASVSAAVVKVNDGAFDFAYADGGVIDVTSVTDDRVQGTFEGVAFEDGSLDGDFDADWCRNLKDR